MTRIHLPRALAALLALLAASGCGPVVAPQQVSATPPITTYDQKIRWILQLEDERQLKGGGGDLLALLQDPEARVRRRAALATGRVRLPAGVAGLMVAPPGAPLPGWTVLCDRDGLLRQRYDARPGTTYLIRPDRYVAARWRTPDEAALASALRRATATG